MKITNLLPVVVMSILMVGAVGCSTMQPPASEDYETISRREDPPARIYVEDPYHFGRTIVMDRDPITGRYYQVNAPLYDSRYDSRYDKRYDNRYSYDRYYSNRDNYPVRRPVQQPSSQQDQANDQKRKDAAQLLFGKKKQ